MNRIKKIATSGLVALGLTMGATVVAPLANASPAEAYTVSGCYTSYYNGWRADRICYYDYNWWEESWMGGSLRDGWYRTGMTTA